MKTLGELQDQVRNYTSQHAELAAAHHYDFGMMLTDSVRFYVIGLTPGETEQELKQHPGAGHLNPNDPKRWTTLPRNAKSWLTRCKNLLATDELLLGDVFFWSAPNMASFRARYGTDLRNSPHLAFCQKMTTALLELYPPKGVLFMGLGHSALLKDIFELKEVFHHPVGRWSVLHLHDGRRPWFVVAHPNSYPRRSEWDAARLYIASST